MHSRRTYCSEGLAYTARLLVAGLQVELYFAPGLGHGTDATIRRALRGSLRPTE